MMFVVYPTAFPPRLSSLFLKVVSVYSPIAVTFVLSQSLLLNLQGCESAIERVRGDG